MPRWTADPALDTLIRRYYAGEGALWETIRQRIAAEVRQRGLHDTAYHIRLLRHNDTYVVEVEDASQLVQTP